ncbi:hypothetical protein [Clostridium tagluense]|uniref:hypothetical protein n=1 Tax=Clostridium tagluense TaxID=360422 RepID=UPI001CF577FE|nr:hypothetical protein [Clostridium tagluense]MCB2297758.1 hypothetical protein [Clostridium tagluense]
MSVVTLILPKDMTILEKKYAEVLADIIAEKLTPEELEYLISELDKKEIKENIS